MSTLSAAIALIGEAVVLGGMPVAYAWFDHVGSQRWGALVEEHELKGDPISLDVAERPPDAENFATHPVFEDVFAGARGDRNIDSLDFERITGFRWVRDAHRGPNVGWQMARRKNFNAMFGLDADPKAVNKQILDSLATVEGQLDSVAGAAERPYCRFDIDWGSETIAAPAEHLSAFQLLVKTFSYKACAHLAADQIDDALLSTATALKLARQLRRERPTLIGHLVLLTVNQIALQPVWEGLAEQRWDRDDLRLLDQLLASDDIDKHFNATFRSERALLVKTLTDFGEGRFPAEQILPDETRRWVAFWPKGIFLLNAVALCELFDLAYFDHPQFDGCEIRRGEDSKALARIASWRSPWRFDVAFARTAFPVFTSIQTRSLQAIAQLRMARVAVALERYRLDELSYPENPEDCVPKYLDPLPVDPVTGHPFRFAFRGDEARPALWSEGVDRIDDGGRTKRSHKLGDWAWQYSVPEGHTLDAYLSRAPIGDARPEHQE